MRAQRFEFRCGLAWVHAIVAMVLGLCALTAHAGWQALTSGQSGFNSPTAYVNLRTINQDTTTLSGEGASRISYSKYEAPGGWFTSSGAVNYTAGNPGLSGFSGNSVSIDSGSNGSASSFTIQFNNGGTSYVAMLIGMSVKEDNTQWIRFTYGSGTQVTLYNCKDAGNATCIAQYVPSNWLLDLINGLLGILFGNNSYDSVYLTYLTPAGEVITKVEVFNDNCPSCAGLLASSAQSMWIDNISYVDPSVMPHHVEVTTSSNSVAANATVTFTIRACADATCATAYTTGMSGTFTVSGAGTTTYPGGQTFTIPARSSSTTITASMSAAGTATVALSAFSRTPSTTPRYWCGMTGTATSTGACTLTVTIPLHHLELLTNATSTVTCVPLTFTVKACADATCANAFTSGVTGTVSVSGTNVQTYSTGFTIASGSGSTSWSAYMGVVSGNSATASASLTAPSVTPTATPATYYGMGAASGTAGGSQSLTLNNSALVFDVKSHTAETAQSVTVTALRKSDNSNACTPLFVSRDTAVNFTCSHSNPATGTVPVRIQDANILAAYQALNASNASTAACDGTGANVTLRFNASGVATINLKYADVGLMGLNASYTANGVVPTSGSDTFVVAPHDFRVNVTTTGNIKAGNPFSATVTARNAAGATTPNFGRESTPEGVTLGAVRTSPRFAGAVTGSLGYTLGSFSSGVATSSNLSYGDVGKIDLAARLTSGSYLGSAKSPAGSTQGSWTSCASENGTCTVPTGATAVVAYGANGLFNFKTGQTGAVACTNANFTDPIVGVGKACYLIVYGGANTAVTGAAGTFIPHHFKTTVSDACTTFTYSGQPVAVSVTAYNASDAAVVNYDGSDATSAYNAARAVSLSSTTGSTSNLSNYLIQASAFAGAATGGHATQNAFTYTFPAKLTAPSAFTIRATDSDGVSSAGYAEGVINLRSGRLQLSNAFGSEKSNLVVPVQVQYWNGKAWAQNTLDNGCTIIPAGAVARSNYLDAKGAAATGGTAWTTAVGANVVMSGGRADLVLQAPTLTSGSGTAAGTVDVAVNLGDTNVDNACMGAHPTASIGGLSWLRSPNGSCSSGNVDPSARMSFGVFKPETQKIIHVQDRY